MKVYSYELNFHSYLTSPVPSYTIFGALCWAVKFLFGERELEKIIQLFDSRELFISSLMPTSNGKKQFFKPILKPKNLTEEDREKLGLENATEFRIFIKKYKKLTYVPLEVLKGVLDGKITDDRKLAYEVRNLSSKSLFPYSILSIPHASINRITGSTSEGGTLYFEETLGVTADSYFFLIAVESQDIIPELITPAIKLLEDWGIGGNRSIGFGSFKLTNVERELELEPYVQSKGKVLINLSKTFPTKNINFEKSYYQIETFRGTVDSGFFNRIWKDKTLYIKEGSRLVLKEPTKTPGMLWKVFDNPNVYQHGIAFPLFIKGEVKDEECTRV